MSDKQKFLLLFWFVVGVCAFAATLSFYVLVTDKSKTDFILTFWLTTGAAGGLLYLIGGNPKETKKPQEPGTATVDISATATSKTDGTV